MNAQSLRCRFGALVSLALMLASLSVSAQTVEYIHTDALGTPTAVTNASRVVIERSEYEAYGKLLNRPLTDGPGFTGHVQDAATNMTYMQQRYYDPTVGRFLSVDPVTAFDSGDMRYFNRYAYVFNNPYIFTDPDGRVVKYSYTNGVSEEQGKRFMIGISMSPSAREEIRQLEESKESYGIVIDGKNGNGVDQINGIVTINPYETLIIESSGEIQSAEVNGAHEISHLAEQDRVGLEAINEALKPPVVDGVIGTSKEENRAVKLEQEVAKDLGEPSRENYDDWVRPN